MSEVVADSDDVLVFSMMARRIAKHAVGYFADGKSEERYTDLPGLGLMLATGCFVPAFDATCDGPSDEQLAAMSSVRHPLRRTSDPGPLCIVRKAAKEKSNIVIEVPELLIHTNLAVRSAVCDFLAELSPFVGTALSHHSLISFREREKAIRSSEPSEWYFAAISLLDVLEKDFLLNVAGFRQCLPLPPEFQAHRSKYWQRILHPVDTPAKHIHFEAFDIAARHETWHTRMQGCVADGDLLQTIKNYVGRFQHIPLSDPYSLVFVIRSHFRISEAFQPLINLAGSEHPFERFQGCQALCEAWSEWNDDQHATAIPVIDKFLYMMFADELDNIDHQLWKCQLLFARHYLYQCELYEPGWHPDAISALAWKISDHVMRVIAPHARAKSAPIKYLSQILSEIIEPALERGELLARTIRVPMFQSLYRLSTLHSAFGSPFGLSVLSSFGPLISHYLPLHESNQCSGIVTITIEELVRCIGKFLPEPRTVVFSKATANWERTLETWLQTQEPHRAGAADRIAQFQKLTDESELSPTLEKLADVDKETRTQTLFIMLQLARMDHLPPQPLWKALTVRSFREMLLRSLDTEELKTFITAVVIVQQGTSPEWAQQLPHVFIDMLQTLTPTDEQADILMGSVIGAAVRSQAYSALRRIRLECRAGRGANILGQYSELILQVSQNTPRWTQLQIKRLLSNIE